MTRSRRWRPVRLSRRDRDPADLDGPRARHRLILEVRANDDPRHTFTTATRATGSRRVEHDPHGRPVRLTLLLPIVPGASEYPHLACSWRTSRGNSAPGWGADVARRCRGLRSVRAPAPCWNGSRLGGPDVEVARYLCSKESRIPKAAGPMRYPFLLPPSKTLARKGPESFPSWTSPVRPRSPALVRSRS